MKKHFLAISLTLCFMQTSVAQSRLFLRPTVGLQMRHSYIAQKADGLSLLKSNSLGNLLGLYIDYQPNEKWKFSTGALITADYILYNTPALLSAIPFTSLRIPLLVHRRFADVKFIKTKHENPQGYLIRCFIEGTAGISYNQAIQQYAIANVPSRQILKKQNVGLELGLGFQLHGVRGGNLLRFDVQYHQGLGALLEVKETYLYKNMQQVGIVQSRGSYGSIKLSMPIRIAKRKN